MTESWSERDPEIDTRLDSLQTGLTVRMIETPRAQLKTCLANELASAVLERNTEQYDFIPVLSDDPQQTVVGLFSTRGYDERRQDRAKISSCMIPLSENHLIGEKTTIQDFIQEAAIKPCRLVVAESGFSGLVTLSDLQKLPVRASLFALVTSFEIVMFDAIKRRFARPEDWRSLLDASRRASLSKLIKHSRKADGYVDDLLFTGFGDKASIIQKSLELPYDPDELKNQFRELKALRNKLAHANDYAAAPTEAKWVCDVVANLLSLRRAIMKTKSPHI